MPPRPSTSIPKLLEDAQAKFNAGNLVAAKELYERVLGLDTTTVDAYVGLGQIAFQRAFLDDAAALFEEAYELALESRDGELPSKLPWTTRNQPLLRAMHGRGMTAFRQGDGANARTWMEALVQRNPSDQQGAKFILDALDRGQTWNQLGGDPTG